MRFCVADRLQVRFRLSRSRPTGTVPTVPFTALTASETRQAVNLRIFCEHNHIYSTLPRKGTVSMTVPFIFTSMDIPTKPQVHLS